MPACPSIDNRLRICIRLPIITAGIDSYFGDKAVANIRGIFMSVNQNVSFDGKKVQIDVRGHFDYKVSKDFRDAYRHIPGREGIAYHVDLKNVDFMDSSALGMLLLLREHAISRGGSVIIQHPSETIDKILRVANFEQLFEIEYLPSGRVGTGI